MNPKVAEWMSQSPSNAEELTLLHSQMIATSWKLEALDTSRKVIVVVPYQETGKDTRFLFMTAQAEIGVDTVSLSRFEMEEYGDNVGATIKDPQSGIAYGHHDRVLGVDEFAAENYTANPIIKRGILNPVFTTGLPVRGGPGCTPGPVRIK